MTHHVAHASIVYWRRSIWNGTRCVPVLMTLDQGWLRAATGPARRCSPSRPVRSPAG
ncbi:hypothetical protein [Micromonospora chersina]|uniref:hypothetical protein n=1 Tax=Micromonospora chersina TaxID=47854 RepID=UPI003404222D